MNPLLTLFGFYSDHGLSPLCCDFKLTEELWDASIEFFRINKSEVISYYNIEEVPSESEHEKNTYKQILSIFWMKSKTTTSSKIIQILIGGKTWLKKSRWIFFNKEYIKWKGEHNHSYCWSEWRWFKWKKQARCWINLIQQQRQYPRNSSFQTPMIMNKHWGYIRSCLENCAEAWSWNKGKGITQIRSKVKSFHQHCFFEKNTRGKKKLIECGINRDVELIESESLIPMVCK